MRLLVAAGFTILGGTTLFRLGQPSRGGRLVDFWAGKEFTSALSPHQPTWLRFGLPANEEEFRRLAAALTRHPDRS